MSRLSRWLRKKMRKYCGFEELLGKLNEQTAEIIPNVMLCHEVLLCDYYRDFIKHLLAINDKKQMEVHNLQHSVYSYFITHQKELAIITQNLDDVSNNILFYSLFLGICVLLFFEDPYGIFIKAKHQEIMLLIDNEVKSTWDILASKEVASLDEQNLPDNIQLAEGMYIIDGGALDGDTAMLFSKYVGTEGKIFSFEPSKESFVKLVGKNIQNNICINKGLYSESKTLKFAYNSEFPGGSCLSEAGADFVEVVSIDEFVEEERIPHIDYIKMDIEGAELPALVGAYKTIRQFHPYLAISIYHNLGRDYIDVPYYLITQHKDIYSFFVRKNHVAWTEITIYALPRKKANFCC